MGLPANPIGAAISGKLSVAKTALPPNPLQGLVSPGVTPVPQVQPHPMAPPSHTLAPGGLEQLQAATEKASAPAVADFNRRAGTHYADVPVGWKPEDLKTIHEMALHNPDVARFWGSLVNPIEWGRQAVEGVKQAGHGADELAHGKLAHGALDVGLGGLSTAAILPFGRGAKGLEEAAAAAEGSTAEHASAGAEHSLLSRPKWLGGGLPNRTPEEATAHLAPLLDQAKAEGWGGHVGSEGHPPVVEHGVATPETHGELGQTVRESLLHAPAVREAQAPLHSLERGTRAAAAEQAMKEAGGGTAGLHAALSELEGRFGRESFPHLQHLTSEQLDTLHHAVDDSPLQTYERITANKALSNAVKDGVAPTEGEQTLLERVFGRVKEDTPTAEPPSLGARAAGLLNVPRAIRSSADLSLSFRQNIVTAVTHPGVFAKSFAKSARMFVDPAYHKAVMDEIHADPYYPYLQKISKGKLFTELGDTAQEGAPLLKREEAFNGGNVAERLNLRELPGPLRGKKYATGPGDVVRASDRSFTGGLNYSRFMVGKNLVEKAALMGHDLSDPKVGESIADVIGVMTGRGKVPRWAEAHLVTANLALFAPRLIAARLNMLSPVYYKQLDPFARGEALTAVRNMVAAMGTVMVAAKFAGASVNFNMQSSNFGKIKFGNTRVDITGGFSQYIRFFAQEMTREAISSAGHKSHVGWGQHDISDAANVWKQVRSKSAPVPSLLLDEGLGRDFIGQPIKQGHELWQNAPFLAQDVYDTVGTGAPPARVMAAAFLSAIGFGVQSYKDKPQGRPTPKGGAAGLPSLPPLPALPALPEKP